MELKKKEFKFKGMTIEELQKLDVREFAKHLRARQRRTVLRQFQSIENFINRSKKKLEKKKQIKTHDRTLIVVPQMVGWKIHIYKGNEFVPVDITGDMFGHKFGEFAPTRARIVHTNKSGAKPKAKK